MTQDHTAALANLATTTKLDRTNIITLTETNAILTQQIIGVNLKLTKALAEVAQLKIEIPAQARANVPALFPPTSHYWSHGKKVPVGHNIRTCTVKKEGYTSWMLREQISRAAMKIIKLGQHDRH